MRLESLANSVKKPVNIDGLFFASGEEVNGGGRVYLVSKALTTKTGVTIMATKKTVDLGDGFTAIEDFVSANGTWKTCKTRQGWIVEHKSLEVYGATSGCGRNAAWFQTLKEAKNEVGVFRTDAHMDVDALSFRPDDYLLFLKRAFPESNAAEAIEIQNTRKKKESEEKARKEREDKALIEKARALLSAGLTEKEFNQLQLRVISR